MRIAIAVSTFVSAASLAAAQGVFDPTNIVGTWSSGSQAVITGPDFANPVESTFTYPQTAGISYSFSDDGFFEEALYRFKGNGTDPRCIVAVVQFQHGEYELFPNGSMLLTPFAQDGRQQIQDPCAAQSNILRQFNQTTFFSGWRIFRNPQGIDKLHIFQFDGMPYAPMFRVSAEPTMLPTRLLTNTTLGSIAAKKGNAGRTAQTTTWATGLFASVGLVFLAGQL